MKIIFQICPKCAKRLRKYKSTKSESNHPRIDYFVCNNNHRLRYINDVFDREVDVSRGAKIVASRNKIGDVRFPAIPGARNIHGRCWSGSE